MVLDSKVGRVGSRMDIRQGFDGGFEMRKFLILVAAGCGLFTLNAVAAESTSLPVIDGARNGDVVINGRAVAGSAPITIYDLSYPVRTALGSSKSMDDNGYFAVSVSPELIAGHKIIAVDKEGSTSPPVIVTAPDPMFDPTK